MRHISFTQTFCTSYNFKQSRTNELDHHALHVVAPAVSRGKSLALDTVTPILRLVQVIGELVFDDNQDTQWKEVVLGGDCQR
eukprot:1286528-Amphidinium_carterae.1